MAFAAVVTLAMVGYHHFGYTLSESLWMLTITLSTVGYGEHPTGTPAFQIFTVVVIVVGLIAAGYTFGGLLQVMIEGELSRSLGQQRQIQQLRKIKDHIVICGFGRIGQVLAIDLQKHGHKFVIIEQSEKGITEAREGRGYPCLEGDATEEDVLLAAGVERAKAVITALPNDASNVFITLTARAIKPDIFIVARAEFPSTERKLKSAGANRVVMPALIGAHIMERLITRPHTADFLELLAETTFTDVEMDEVDVPAGSFIADKQLANLSVFRELNLLVVAVKQPDGELIFNPGPKHTFSAGEVILVTGHAGQISSLRSMLRESH